MKGLLINSSMIELLYNIKKYIIKKWKMYFTTEGTYTCFLPDKLYLKLLYKKRTGETLNLRSPKTYNEKLNWLKLYDRKPEYTMLVDKYTVREYVKRVIGEEYLIPLIGCWNSVEDIDFDALPSEFVLKCNHDNGVFICKDKKYFDDREAKRFLNTHLSRNYYKKAREWPYKNVKRKIIAEHFIRLNDENELLDYKFFCFGGVVKLCCVISRKNRTIDFYDSEFKHIDIRDKWPNSEKLLEPPTNYKKMIMIAERLSAEIPHVRVDLYNVEGKIFFGEMTFFDDAGFGKKEPIKWERIIGDWIDLPRN